VDDAARMAREGGEEERRERREDEPAGEPGTPRAGGPGEERLAARATAEEVGAAARAGPPRGPGEKGARAEAGRGEQRRRLGREGGRRGRARDDAPARPRLLREARQRRGPEGGREHEPDLVDRGAREVDEARPHRERERGDAERGVSREAARRQECQR